MKKADRRVEPHRFQGAADIVHQQGVHEREKAIHLVQRWPAAAFVKPEILLLGGDQMVEHPEIGTGRIPFNAAQRVQGIGTRKLLQRKPQSDGRPFQCLAPRFFPVIA